MTGVSTSSQSCRKGIPCSNRSDCCPGPSKTKTFHPRSSPDLMPSPHSPDNGPSLPLVMTTVARAAPSGPLNARVSGGRVIATVDTRLEDFRKIRAEHGGTVNDVLLSPGIVA